MRIIKKGKPKERLWRGTCTDCNSVIEAKQSELAVTNDHRAISEESPNGDFGRANCPVCGHGMVFYPVKKTEEDHQLPI